MALFLINVILNILPVKQFAILTSLVMNKNLKSMYIKSPVKYTSGPVCAHLVIAVLITYKTKLKVYLELCTGDGLTLCNLFLMHIYLSPMKKKSFEDTKKKNHEMKSTDTEPFGEYEVLEHFCRKLI